jgi:MFS family permease
MVCLFAMAGAYALAYLYGHTAFAVYGVMALAGIGWSAIVSLPFAIMSERVDESHIGLFMGIFNLSVVLPQLVASLGIGTLVALLPDKGAVFLVSAVSLTISAICWLFVRAELAPTVTTTTMRD